MAASSGESSSDRPASAPAPHASRPVESGPAPAAKALKDGSAAPAKPMVSPVVTLPKVEVTASRIKELDREIKRLDKAISREKKKLKAGELDRSLNNAKVAQAASIFGGNSTEHLELVAAQRLSMMETERELLVDMKQPRSLDELALFEKELARIRQMQRDLDNVSR